MDARPAGALGPRLAGRLTAELISRSPQYMNCIALYELNLRGNKIAAIENLGATENQFDCIDLTDNAVVRLEGFPKLNRLKQLLVSNNRIMRIAKGLEATIPNLELLMLANNRLTNFQDLDPLATLPKLSNLCLSGNPVSLKQNYRLYVVSKLKNLKVLDFRKVKQKERDAAEKMFATEAAKEQHAANTFEPTEDLDAAQAAATAAAAAADANGSAQASTRPKGPTPDQLIAIQAAIANAQTLEEIKQLEEALTSGRMPSHLLIDAPQPRPAAAQAPPAQAPPPQASEQAAPAPAPQVQAVASDQAMAVEEAAPSDAAAASAAVADLPNGSAAGGAAAGSQQAADGMEAEPVLAEQAAVVEAETQPPAQPTGAETQPPAQPLGADPRPDGMDIG